MEKISEIFDMTAVQYFVILKFNFLKINTKIIGNKLLFPTLCFQHGGKNVL